MVRRAEALLARALKETQARAEAHPAGRVERWAICRVLPASRRAVGGATTPPNAERIESGAAALPPSASSTHSSEMHRPSRGGQGRGHSRGLREPLWTVLKTRGFVTNPKMSVQIHGCDDVKQRKLRRVCAVSAAKMTDVVREYGRLHSHVRFHGGSAVGSSGSIL